MGPCHITGKWQSCDLNLGRFSPKGLSSLGDGGLEATTAPCDVLRTLKKVLFSGLEVLS